MPLPIDDKEVATTVNGLRSLVTELKAELDISTTLIAELKTELDLSTTLITELKSRADISTTLVTELKLDLDALRVDYITHDHAATYDATDLRSAASGTGVNTGGTATAIAAPAPTATTAPASSATTAPAPSATTVAVPSALPSPSA